MIFEIGLPRKTVTTKQEAIDYINRYNGMKAIYKTVYKFKEWDGKKPIYDTAIIDKLFFDFDGDDSWNEANKLHQYLWKADIKHTIIMSGRGYHIFVLCEIYSPANSKATIYNGQHYFIDQLELECDRQIIGDNARLHRIPNTFNLKAKRYCIPLTEEQFNLGDEKIKNLAEKQNFVENITIGTKRFDVSKLDYKADKFDEHKIFDSGDFESSFGNIEYAKGCPPCIKSILLNKNATWKERYLLILYFKEMGYTRQEIFEILRKSLSENKLIHCVSDEQQLQYLFDRDELMFPSCSNIANDGFCPQKCEKYGKVIYK